MNISEISVSPDGFLLILIWQSRPGAHIVMFILELSPTRTVYDDLSVDFTSCPCS